MKNLNAIEFAQLEVLISNKLGFPIKFDVAIGVFRNGDEYFKIESQELKQVAGIMAPVYESLKLTNSGGSLCPDETAYWINIKFSYSFKTGGSNGTSFCACFYRFATEDWIIE
jgi:hypothetical protein